MLKGHFEQDVNKTQISLYICKRLDLYVLGDDALIS